MKSKLILVTTNGMSSDDWLKYRKKGIGASEVSTVMGLNPYKSSIELFYDKIEPGLPYNVENIAMFMGKEQENFIADLWQYWEGSDESMMKNYRAGKIIRRCRRVNAYVHNPDYPWLFVSLDRVINKTADKDEGALEIKTIAGYEGDKWENGIPPGHVVQVQTQTTVCEFIHGELATLRDGRGFDVLPFDHHSGISESIVRVTGEFWRRVEEGRKITTRKYEAERAFNFKEVEKLQAELQLIEPEPDGSEAYTSFLKKKYQIAAPGERPGTPEQLEDAQTAKKFSEQIKTLEENKRLFENRLKNHIRDGCEKLDFGANGYVSWKANVNGTRVFLNKTK